MTPEELIEKQVEVYNARDLEGFVALFSPTVQSFDLPTGALICEGEVALRERYSRRFESVTLHAEIVSRIVHGNRVIDHERIQGMRPDTIVEAVAIYEVVNELIQRVWFIM